MSVPVGALPDAVAAAYSDALRRWRADFAPSTPSADLLALAVESVQVTFVVRSGRPTSVTVTVEARKAHDSASYQFRIERAGGDARLYRD